MDVLEKELFNTRELHAGNGRASLRSLEDSQGKRWLVGYAATFNNVSNLIREYGKTFFEVLRPGAFRSVLANPALDVVLNLNHDNSQLLARTTAGTLQLIEDSIGLKFIAELPRTQLAEDTWQLVKRGDHNQCSFVFWVNQDGQEWQRHNGQNLRVIKKVAGLQDVSIVTFAAYSNTSVKARDLDIMARGGSIRAYGYRDKNKAAQARKTAINIALLNRINKQRRYHE